MNDIIKRIENPLDYLDEYVEIHVKQQEAYYERKLTPEEERGFAERTRKYYEKQVPSGDLICSCVRIDGKIVSTATFLILHSFPMLDEEGIYAYVSACYTQPEHRRKGYMQDCINMLRDYCVENCGLEAFYLDTLSNNMSEMVTKKLNMKKRDDYYSMYLI